MKRILCPIAFVAVCLTACQEKPSEVQRLAEARKVPEWKGHSMLGYEVIREFPHDSGAFTQGLLVSQGQWIESTGGYGTSGIRRVERESGKILKKTDLPAEFFGEGAAEMDGKIYQLTWQSQRGFIYDTKTLRKLDEFQYQCEFADHEQRQ
jgi:glutamine cyclotransferase